MKHVFIINPTSGKRDRSAELIAEVERVARTRDLDWAYQITQHPLHATELARAAALGQGEVRLYACGGDGTLNEVVNGAAGLENAAVTHWATGSGNDFVRAFGAGAAHFQVLERLLDSDEREIDLIDCNGRLAINICSVGIDARVGMGMAEFKRLPLVTGKLAYQLSTIKQVLLGVQRPFTVTVDGERFEGDFTMLCACNGRYYGGGFLPSPDARPDDGLLNFLIVKGVTRRKAAAVVGTFAAGRAAELPDLIALRQGREMTVTCDRMSIVNLDGERMDATELSIRLSAKKLRFFYPRAAGWNFEKRAEK